jgi:hypothetical protein
MEEVERKSSTVRWVSQGFAARSLWIRITCPVVS